MSVKYSHQCNIIEAISSSAQFVVVRTNQQFRIRFIMLILKVCVDSDVKLQFKIYHLNPTFIAENTIIRKRDIKHQLKTSKNDEDKNAVLPTIPNQKIENFASESKNQFPVRKRK